MTRPQIPIHKDPFIWIMISLFLVCIAGMIINFVTIIIKVDTKDMHGQIFVVRMLQVTLGLVIGCTMTFLGMVSAWFGLTEEMEGGGSAGDMRMKIASAGPGALLIIAGTVLVYTCVHKEVSYSENIDDGAGFKDIRDGVVEAKATPPQLIGIDSHPPMRFV